MKLLTGGKMALVATGLDDVQIFNTVKLSVGWVGWGDASSQENLIIKSQTRTFLSLKSSCKLITISWILQPVGLFRKFDQSRFLSAKLTFPSHFC
jgi:hypothetical protein